MKDMRAAAWRWRTMLLAKAEHPSTTEIEAGALRDKAARLTLKYGSDLAVPMTEAPARRQASPWYRAPSDGLDGRPATNYTAMMIREQHVTYAVDCQCDLVSLLDPGGAYGAPIGHVCPTHGPIVAHPLAPAQPSGSKELET